jgi:hypothetical protein
MNALSSELKQLVIDGDLSLDQAVVLNSHSDQLNDIDLAILESMRAAEAFVEPGGNISSITIPQGPIEKLLRNNRFAGLKLLTRQLGVKLNIEDYISGGVRAEADNDTHVSNLTIKTKTPHALEVALFEIKDIILDPIMFKIKLETRQEVNIIVESIMLSLHHD